MRKLFVSYARENKGDIDQLVEHLTMMSYSTWVDEELRGGQDWWQEILKRIADSDAFIATISRATLNSTACQRELDWAEALGKPVVPVAIEPPALALPSRIVRRQIINYSRPAERALDALRLQGGLATLPPAPPLPEPLPEPPEPPWSYLTELVDLATTAHTLDYEQQHQVLLKLESALRSADPEERRGGRDILERFSSRRDIYADVDRTITRLRSLADVADPVTTTKPRRRVRPKASAQFTQSTGHDDKAAPPPTLDVERPSPESITNLSVFRHAWKAMLASGVLSLLMGVLLVFATPVTPTAAGVFASAYLLVIGAAQAILAFATLGWARRLLIVSAAASVFFAAIAVPVVLNADQSDSAAYFVGIWFGWGFMNRGVAEAVSAARGQLVPGRPWFIARGAISVVVGVFLWVFSQLPSGPLSALVNIMVASGFCLAIYGIVEIVSSYGIRRATAS